MKHTLMILLGVRSNNSVRSKLEQSSSSAPGLDSVLLWLLQKYTLAEQLLHEEQLQLDELIQDSDSSFTHGVHGGPRFTTTVSGVGVGGCGGGVKGGLISSMGSSGMGVADAQTEASCIMLNKYSSMGFGMSNAEIVHIARSTISPCATINSCS